MECEECGLDISDGEVEVDVSPSWVTVTLTCECGASYSQDMQMCHFDRDDAYDG